jgi:hypothetical protein
VPEITDILVAVGNLIIAAGVAFLLIGVGRFFEKM